MQQAEIVRVSDKSLYSIRLKSTDLTVTHSAGQDSMMAMSGPYAVALSLAKALFISTSQRFEHCLSWAGSSPFQTLDSFPIDSKSLTSPVRQFWFVSLC